MWVWPQVPLGGTSPYTPLCSGTPAPPCQPGRPLLEHHKKSQGGGGKRRGGGQGGKACEIEGRVLQCNGGKEEDRPKRTWGQTHI